MIRESGPNTSSVERLKVLRVIRGLPSSRVVGEGPELDGRRLISLRGGNRGNPGDGDQCSRAPNLGGLLIEISVKARRAAWGSPCRCGFSHDSAPELGAFCAASEPRTKARARRGWNDDQTMR